MDWVGVQGEAGDDYGVNVQSSLASQTPFPLFFSLFKFFLSANKSDAEIEFSHLLSQPDTINLLACRMRSFFCL